MKNYSIKERQEIYEHLLTLDCPDLLAALIAQRADRPYYSGFIKPLSEDLSTYISNNFIWEHTPEGQEFWEELEAELFEMTLNREPVVPDVIESTEREMFDKATITPEVDFAPTEITPAKIEINVDVSKFNQEMEKVKLTPFRIPQPQEYLDYLAEMEKVSFWTRVKLFFGKWIYKV